MDLVEIAHNIAEDKLRFALPRRWSHVRAVAAKADRVSIVVSEAEQPLLVASAWLHDIGYAPDLATTGFHALDGARWLQQHGFDARVPSLVANHSCALFEADERGLTDSLRSEFPAEQSFLADALWYADMTTRPDGQDFEVLDRLAEIRTRYGPDHLVTRFWARAERTLVAAVRRTEERLTAATHQPM